jgi:uncharacterized YigZ family protein
VEEARDFINGIKAELPGATHHVYAFAVGFGSSVTHGMTDDGEPSGTAGRPTLAVVQGSGLGDVCVVTARFFGGTKLGTGGLVRAYTRAAQEVLAGVQRTERVERCHVTLEVPYPLYEPLHRLLESHGASVEAEEFELAVTILAEVDLDRLTALHHAVAEASSGSVEVQPIDP